MPPDRTVAAARSDFAAAFAKAARFEPLADAAPKPTKPKLSRFTAARVFCREVF